MKLIPVEEFQKDLPYKITIFIQFPILSPWCERQDGSDVHPGVQQLNVACAVGENPRDSKGF